MFDEGTIVDGSSAQYEIIRELSMGEFAISYEAKNLSNGESVFLKKYIDPTPLLKEEFTSFVDHQKKVNARLNSLGESFEKITDEFQFIHHYYLVKPFYKAVSLEKWLTGQHSTEERLALAGNLAGILVEMETSGIIHFDLKPPQVMVFPDGKVILCDFDFSILTGAEESQAHKVAMTPFYFAPEHLKKDLAAFSQATNVFLMALVVFEMLTAGHKPHVCTDIEEFEAALMGHNVRRLREIDPTFPEGLDTLLYDCFTPDPAARPDVARVAAVLAGGAGSNASRLEIRAGDSLPLSIWKETVVGRDQMRIFGENRKYAEKEQFCIFPGEDGWYVKKMDGVTNHTKVNGVLLEADPIQLKSGDELQVGPLKMQLSFVG